MSNNTESNQEEVQDIDDNTAIAIAQEWLATSAQTASNNQFEEHFNIISKKVIIKGVPGYESISYDDWARQSEQEFKEKLINSVSYDGLKMLAHNNTQVMFKTIEKIVANDGTSKKHGIEILLTQEDDNIWRVVQERVMTHGECVHDGLMKSL